MTTISRDIVIAAPAGAVWQVVAHQFDRIGEWATAIPSSRPSASAPGGVGAPVRGRVCHTGIRLAPQVEERIVSYDEAGRTLTYEAVRPPKFLKSARNRWHVEAIDGQHSRVSIRASVEPLGIIGRVMYLMLRLQLARTVPQFLHDLEHYVRHARPSPRKQRQLSKQNR